MLKTFSGRKASQDEFELRSFIGIIKDAGCQRYLEIGARHGDTFHEVMISLPLGSYGLAVDLPGGLWGKSATRQNLELVIDDLRARGYRVDALFGDSTNPNVIDLIHDAGPFDVALIDGDHRYAGVKADWENYMDAANIIAFHDIVGHDQAEKVHGHKVEVPRLWSEIKKTLASNRELIGEGSKMGIGVCDLR